ncbi:hypothetical protein QBC47DRAFT_358471 [Echria macrotheca]|uniref:Secreted protein n=1 Tax=Echria macrotheca TaxID=438768 RepID=A0AAJ0FEY8_9PEZI|nr:hypothetical protein QBC47DRAFT_358471 [Echria macrotheca]
MASDWRGASCVLLVLTPFRTGMCWQCLFTRRPRAVWTSLNRGSEASPITRLALNCWPSPSASRERCGVMYFQIGSALHPVPDSAALLTDCEHVDQIQVGISKDGFDKKICLSKCWLPRGFARSTTACFFAGNGFLTLESWQATHSPPHCEALPNATAEQLYRHLDVTGLCWKNRERSKQAL